MFLSIHKPGCLLDQKICYKMSQQSNLPGTTNTFKHPQLTGSQIQGTGEVQYRTIYISCPCIANIVAIHQPYQPATPHHLQNPKWPQLAPKWPTGTGNGFDPRLLVGLYTSLHKVSTWCRGSENLCSAKMHLDRALAFGFQKRHYQ